MKQRQHFELYLEQIMEEREYHPNTQDQLWRLVGRSAISCEALIDTIAIIEDDQRCRELDVDLQQDRLFAD